MTDQAINPHDHLGLVYSCAVRVARKWSRPGGVDADELVAEGYFALERAAKGFDPSRGYQFSTYACTAIEQAMRDQLTGSRGKVIHRRTVPADPHTLAKWRPGIGQCPVELASMAEKKELARHYAHNIDSPANREAVFLVARGNNRSQAGKIAGVARKSMWERCVRAREEAEPRLLTAVGE